MEAKIEEYRRQNAESIVRNEARKVRWREAGGDRPHFSLRLGSFFSLDCSCLVSCRAYGSSSPVGRGV